MKRILLLIPVIAAPLLMTGCKNTKKVVATEPLEVRVSGTHADHIVWEESDLK